MLLNPYRYATASYPPSIADTDPLYKHVTILLRGDGTAGGPIVDHSGNAWVKAGNAANDGAGAILFDGSGDEIHVTRPKAIGTGDFSVEQRIRVTNLSSDRELFCISATNRSTSAFDLVFEVKTTGAIRGSVQNGTGGTNVDITSAAGLISAGVDYDVSFDVEGTTARVRINGAVVATGTITGTRVQNQPEVRIGELSNTAGFPRYHNGKVYWTRVTAGVCRNSGAGTVTPPTEPIPAWVGPVFDSRFTISSTNDVQSLVVDSTHVWVTNSSTIFKYTKAGSLVTSRNVSTDFVSGAALRQVNGLALSGGVLYAVVATYNAGTGTADTYVAQYDPSTLAYITHNQVAGNFYGEDIEFRDGYAWLVFHAHKQVCKVDTSTWAVAATYTLTGFTLTGSSGGYGGTQGYESGVWIGNYLVCNVHEIYDQEEAHIFYWNGTGFDAVARWGRPTTWSTQGVATDPSDANVLWMVERASGGDSVAKFNLL